MTINNQSNEFTQQLWNSISEIYEGIVVHPFNQQLAKGTLDEDAFRNYLAQDSLYLREDTRALAITAANATDFSEIKFFLNLANEGLEIERILHDTLMKQFQVKPADEKNDICARYCNFLINTAFNATYEESAAALLPCYWLYRESGIAVIEQSVPNNPYQAWLDTYSGEEFDIITKQFIDVIEKIARRSTPDMRQKMASAFYKSARLELEFFDAFI